MKRCKILIIAGGGIFGCIPAHFLGMLPTDWQSLVGVNVISGCSIGGILAAAYAVGQSFSYIDQVFQERARECFTKRFAARLNPLACPTYDSNSLYSVIDDMIGNVLMRDIRKIFPNLSLVVPALDATRDDPLTFHNLTHEYDNVLLKDVAKMTSAAPTYFDCVEFEGRAIIDGGLIDVDGAMTAVSTVKKHCGTPFMGMDVLVLGTGQDLDKNPLNPKTYRKLNLLGFAKMLREYATLGNKKKCKEFLSGLGLHYFNYFNPLITDGELDDVSQIPDLIKAVDKHRDEFVKVWEEWLNR